MSEAPPEAAAESRRWFTEAHEELAVADVLRADGKLPARAACFHAHLAAEKALKALIIARGIELRRTHDLAYLRTIVPIDDAGRFDVNDLAALNPWTIEGRYPADLAEAAAADVKDLAEAARRVVTEVERLLVADTTEGQTPDL
jgi:HEPN domain-containing protein